VAAFNLNLSGSAVMSPTVSVIDDDTDLVTLSRYYSIIDSFTRVRDDDITPMVVLMWKE
jgi:hypothetical protein